MISGKNSLYGVLSIFCLGLLCSCASKPTASIELHQHVGEVLAIGDYCHDNHKLSPETEGKAIFLLQQLRSELIFDDATVQAYTAQASKGNMSNSCYRINAFIEEQQHRLASNQEIERANQAAGNTAINSPYQNKPTTCTRTGNMVNCF